MGDTEGEGEAAAVELTVELTDIAGDKVGVCDAAEVELVEALTLELTDIAGDIVGDSDAADVELVEALTVADAVPLGEKVGHTTQDVDPTEE